jgi:PmbA protein
MLSLRELEEAARKALEFLGTQEDVEEAEVFISCNGILHCRLNYTSHIPSNGVEEPKSLENFGIGLRVVLRRQGGEERLVGFGSEPGDLSLEGVRLALEKARRGAVVDPEFTTLPRPTGEPRRLWSYHDPQIMDLGEAELVDLGWRVVRQGLRAFQAAEPIIHRDPQELALILGGDVTVLQERMAICSTHMPQVQTDESTLILSFITAMVEGEGSKGSGYDAVTQLGQFTGEAGREAAENAVRGMGGVRVPGGSYRVVLGRQAFMDLLENLIIPGLSLGTFYAAASPFLGRLGQQVASTKLTIIDDGAAPGLAASKGITCEGLPTGRTELIRDGVLVGLLSNYYESQRILRDPRAREKLGVDPHEWRHALTPRNGFRFARGGGRHYDSQPGIHATNIIIPGDMSHQDLLRVVGDGLYIGRIWYTYPVNGLRAGDFTATVVGDSFVIRGGQLAEPIRPNTLRINDNIHRVLQGILGVGREARPTIVWAADEIVYAPEIAVEALEVQPIAHFMEPS